MINKSTAELKNFKITEKSVSFTLPSLFHVERCASIHGIGDIQPLLDTIIMLAENPYFKNMLHNVSQIHGGIWECRDKGLIFRAENLAFRLSGSSAESLPACFFVHV
jgi:hypothetical protein